MICGLKHDISHIIIIQRRVIIMKGIVRKICVFLNSLAHTSKHSYSLIGPYEPKMPDKLKD